MNLESATIPASPSVVPQARPIDEVKLLGPGAPPYSIRTIGDIQAERFLQLEEDKRQRREAARERARERSALQLLPCEAGAERMIYLYDPANRTTISRRFGSDGRLGATEGV